MATYLYDLFSRKVRYLRAGRPALTVGVALAVLSMAAACGGGGGSGETPATETPSGETPTAETPAAQQLSAVVVTSDLAEGPNRFAIGLVDQEAGGPVLDAQVHFRFFKVLEGDQAELRFEADPEFVGFETFFIDESKGEKVVTGDTGMYVTNVEFDVPGDWGVEVTGTRDGQEIGPLLTGFIVLEKGQTLTLGDPAPRSRQPTIDDVTDLLEIDTASPADPEMHSGTIADAIATGKPVVVLFGTPAFCETQTCGPVQETVMVPLSEQYDQDAIFIHVEPYFLTELREGTAICSVPAFNLEFASQGVGEGPGPCPELSEDELQAVGESWNLTTEPILFVIDQDGNIAGKFEAIVGPQEVEPVLQDLLGPAG